MSEKKRGAFICLEGIDHSGKTSQSRLLAEYLKGAGVACRVVQFPDRSTPIGAMISDYLTEKARLDDRAAAICCSRQTAGRSLGRSKPICARGSP